MSTNPLESRLQNTAKRGAIKQDVSAWIDRGNRLLWGEEPDKDGAFCKPRRDLEWRCENGSYYIAARGNGPLRLASSNGR